MNLNMEMYHCFTKLLACILVLAKYLNEQLKSN